MAWQAMAEVEFAVAAVVVVVADVDVPADDPRHCLIALLGASSEAMASNHLHSAMAVCFQTYAAACL